MSWPYGMAGPRGCLLMLDSRLSCIEFVREAPRRVRSGAAALRATARQVGQLQNTPPYWIADLPPSYAVATATSMAPDCQLPPPYSAVADVHGPLRGVYSDVNKPASESTTFIGPPPTCIAAAPDAAVVVEAGSPLHVPSGDGNRTLGAPPAAAARTASTSVGTDTRHPSNCCCDACGGPC